MYLLKEYEDELRDRYSYAFNPGSYKGALPKLRLHGVTDGVFKLGPFEIETFSLEHGSVNSMGIKIEDFIYATDFKRMSDKLIEKFGGISKLWLLAAFILANTTHSTILETMVISKIRC